VVPPNQAVDMYNALKEKGLSTALVLFPGEQHGFRQVHDVLLQGFSCSMPAGATCCRSVWG
jgi:acetyl esterase/lipase